MLLLNLINHRYSEINIELEKPFQGGTKGTGSYLDVYIKNNDFSIIYMLEVKQKKEHEKAKKTNQLFNYAYEEQNTHLIAYYSYDFEKDSSLVSYVIIDDLLKQAKNKEDLFSIWDKNGYYCQNDFIKDTSPFCTTFVPIMYENLKDIEKEDIHKLFKNFTEILRVYAVSDKSNAFNKIINLFLCKIVDEVHNNSSFQIKTKENTTVSVKSGLKFQYIKGIDTNESLFSRLNDLYKEGSLQYLKKEIIDYSEEDL